MEFKHRELDNGLTIIAEVNRVRASIAAGFFVRTGSRDETPEVSGVSHFLEHMTFKGTAGRGALEVNRDFDRLGASYNAFTSEENTMYYAAVLPEFQTEMLDILCDILRPALRQGDFDVEKGVILDEIAALQDVPGHRVYEKLMATHFAGHPLGNLVSGTPESIKALKREDMQAHFDRCYSPGNITVTGTGNVDFEAFADKVSQVCSSWQPVQVTRETPPPPKETKHEVIADKKVAREHVGLLARAPSGQDQQRYAAQLAATIVGDATGSRLYYALVAPAVADEASMMYNPLDGAGLFLTFISADADRAVEAVGTARDELKRFLQEGPTDTELQAAKNKVASGATLKGELPVGRLTAVGFDWIYRKTYEPLPRQIETLFAVTGDEVLEVARQYDLTATTLLALGPLESL